MSDNNKKNGAQGQGIEVSMGQGTVEVAGTTVGTFLTQLYATARHEQEVGARVAEGALGFLGTLGAGVLDLVRTKLQGDARVELVRAQAARDAQKVERERERTRAQAQRTERVRTQLEREKFQQAREDRERELREREEREEREEQEARNGRASMTSHWTRGGGAPDEL